MTRFGATRPSLDSRIPPLTPTTEPSHIRPGGMMCVVLHAPVGRQITSRAEVSSSASSIASELLASRFLAKEPKRARILTQPGRSGGHLARTRR
jgi:hypothetical protein